MLSITFLVVGTIGALLGKVKELVRPAIGSLRLLAHQYKSLTLVSAARNGHTGDGERVYGKPAKQTHSTINYTYTNVLASSPSSVNIFALYSRNAKLRNWTELGNGDATLEKAQGTVESDNHNTSKKVRLDGNVMEPELRKESDMEPETNSYRPQGIEG